MSAWQGSTDREVLEWAADEGRLVLTHDFATMLDFAYIRVERSLPMPGVVALSQNLAIGEAIEELAILVEYNLESEWENQVVFIPLKN